MAQLVIKPGMATPFGAAARHVQQQCHELVVSTITAIGRIRSARLEAAGSGLRREATYLETARMAREMYRL